MNKTERILFILDNLSHRETVTTGEMKAKFKKEEIEVSERNVQRDLEFLGKKKKLKKVGQNIDRENIWL